MKTLQTKPHSVGPMREVNENDTPPLPPSVSPELQTRSEPRLCSPSVGTGRMVGAFEEELLQATFSVANLARARGLSVRQFERKFHEKFGMCPRETMLEIRMALASRRVLSELPLKQIATDLSYHDTASFSKAFRQYFGMSPLEMRRGLFEVSRRTAFHVAFSQQNVAF